MNRTSRLLVVACAAAVALVVAAGASAHARISPSVSLSKKLQLYSLAVPTEKEGPSTTKIVLTYRRGSRSTRSSRARLAADVQSTGRARTP